MWQFNFCLLLSHGSVPPLWSVCWSQSNFTLFLLFTNKYNINLIWNPSGEGDSHVCLCLCSSAYKFVYAEFSLRYHPPCVFLVFETAFSLAWYSTLLTELGYTGWPLSPRAAFPNANNLYVWFLLNMDSGDWTQILRLVVLFPLKEILNLIFWWR